MRAWEIIKKNFKLLFRARETTFVILFGPFLIMLLIGFAFSGSNNIDINLGVYSSNYTSLTNNFISELNKEYAVNILSSKEECLSYLKEGKVHLCIFFPDNFIIEENHSNVVDFVIDNSRINLAYQVIDSLNKRFNIQSKFLTKDLTKEILDTLIFTNKTLSEQLVFLNNTLSSLNQLLLDLDNSNLNLKTVVKINNDSITLNKVKGLGTTLSLLGSNTLSETNKNLDEISSFLKSVKSDLDNSSKEEIDYLLDDIDSLKIDIDKVLEDKEFYLSEFYDEIDNLSIALINLNNNLNALRDNNQIISSSLENTKINLDKNINKLLLLKANLKLLLDKINSLSITDINTITNPVITNIKTISSNNQLIFMYPYIIILVIMFMGLILGSLLVVNDKNSPASFRNFTTSTSSLLQVLTSFFTTFFILLIQILFLILASFLLVKTPFLNFQSFIVIIVAASLFSFLGMIIGFLSNNAEASMVFSLSIGSIMLFISNLVIPIEAMNLIIRFISKFNPYVILSEMLKKTILFNQKVNFLELFLLLFSLIIIFIIVVLIDLYNKKSYFQKKKPKTITVKNVKPLIINGREVRNEFDLITVLDFMTREEFYNMLKKGNIIADWVENELKNKRLAKKLRINNKEKMILRLDKYLKKRSKK